MIKPDIKFDFDDLLIVPKDQSTIDSRSDINVYDENEMLPLFTAPMDTVVGNKNMEIFKQNKIYPIIPRTSNFIDYTIGWGALGLNEFEKIINSEFENDTIYVLVDIANGNMKKMHDLIAKRKSKYGNRLQLMVGNVANPETYRIVSELGADYVRIGVGNGGGCLTSKNVGVGYPMASLINECYEISCTLLNPAKIVADGGMKNYSDIIKALGLGADMVMLGSILNRSLESIGETFKANVKHVGVETWTEPGEPVDQFSEDVKNAFLNGAKYFKKFRGMSTKSVQKSLGNKTLKTSEGVTRMNQVEYTLDGWVENFTHYLASAMSYSGAKTLDDFIGKADFVKITQNSFNRFNK